MPDVWYSIQEEHFEGLWPGRYQFQGNGLLQERPRRKEVELVREFDEFRFGKFLVEERVINQDRIIIDECEVDFV